MNSTKNELEISLFYKGKYSDYVVFYDLSGEEIYYKYRRNKFDIRAERRVISLVPGYAYRVNGNFIGMYIYKNKAENKLNPIPVYLKKTDVQKENILEKNNTPVLNFIFAKPIFLNQLIY
ncbi:MAG: hypothetical protein H7A23_23170 [Leptospiraceae bacterium]|nr:hypothetical protein [Leptospiraceae bacterium]MCP5497468.1 hypothetical protein [Leptospiraceae bacterium]